MSARASRVLLVAVLFASGVLTGCGDEYEKGAGVYSSTPTPTAPAAPGSSASGEPVQSAGSAGAQEAAEAAALSSAQRANAEAAETAARAFLAGYLPYSYGQADARELRGVAPELRDELARHPPRVPPAKSEQAHPQLRRLQLSGVDSGRVILLAQIDDGDSRYAALVTVDQRDGDWLVTEVQ